MSGEPVGTPNVEKIVTDVTTQIAFEGYNAAETGVVDLSKAEIIVSVGRGINGAIQHLAGMKKSEFVAAINTDKDVPIGEIADWLLVADLKRLVSVLAEKLNSL